MCCLFCFYKNMHQNHKLIELSDNESLKKENINIDSNNQELIDVNEKIVELKNKIESEIEKINSLFDKTMEEVTKSYKRKHEKLLKEENDLKEKLKTEVTKIKEKLETTISGINEGIKIKERINKGIKSIKNEEKNIIKNLSFISKINKTLKNMKNILQNNLKNINFEYIEEKSTIIYKEFFFNLNPIKFEVKNLTDSSLEISLINDYKNDLSKICDNIKYIVELKKENEDFQKVYEGNNNYCLIENLIPFTNYEIRARIFQNNIFGEWSEVQKIKTKHFDSLILKESNKESKLYEILKEWIKFKNLELIYRGTRDGMIHDIYHKKCDNKGRTIILMKNEKDNIFGGYASDSWIVEHCKYTNSQNSFLFSLTNMHNSEPIKFPIKKADEALYYRNDYGPLFGNCGNDLGLRKDFLNDGGFCHNFNGTYSDSLGKGKTVFIGDTKSNDFKLKEIKVYKIN